MPAVPRPRPPYLHRQVSRHGTVAWYVRRGHGRKIRIRGVFGSPEFQAAYEAAIAGNRPAAPAGGAQGTVAWLWARYCQVGAWTELAASTRYKRQKIMDRVLKTGGRAPLSALDKAAVLAGVELRKAKPSTAQAFVDTLRGMFKWALAADHVKVDPTAGVQVNFKPKRKGGYPTWTEEDLAKFETRWPLGTRERLLFDILAYSGLRIGDVAVLGRQHVRNNVIKLDNEKTGTRVELPLLAPLRASIAAAPTGDLAFLVTRRGLPWNKGALGAYFVECANAAGVFGKSAHGVRKAGATRAAENGATERELEAIFGWAFGSKQSANYTRAADRKRLADGAIHKLDRPAETENGTSIPPPEDEVGAKILKLERDQ